MRPATAPARHTGVPARNGSPLHLIFLGRLLDQRTGGAATDTLCRHVASAALGSRPRADRRRRDARRGTAKLARSRAHVEQWRYKRFWLAEHYDAVGIASAATGVVLNIAAGTKTIRVGAGGIMLPNHPPLVIAEQFGALAAPHPGRIDLGLGCAPGTDQLTIRALRRDARARAVGLRSLAAWRRAE